MDMSEILQLLFIFFLLLLLNVPIAVSIDLHVLHFYDRKPADDLSVFHFVYGQ